MFVATLTRAGSRSGGLGTEKRGEMMRKSVVVAVVLAIVAGLTGAWVAVAPLAGAHAGHVITIADTSAPEGTASGQAPALQTMKISISQAPQVGEEITVQWSTSEMQPTPEARQADL